MTRGHPTSRGAALLVSGQSERQGAKQWHPTASALNQHVMHYRFGSGHEARHRRDACVAELRACLKILCSYVSATGNEAGNCFNIATEGCMVQRRPPLQCCSAGSVTPSHKTARQVTKQIHLECKLEWLQITAAMVQTGNVTSNQSVCVTA